MELNIVLPHIYIFASDNSLEIERHNKERKGQEGLLSLSF